MLLLLLSIFLSPEIQSHLVPTAQSLETQLPASLQ